LKQNKTALITGITEHNGSYLADLFLSKGYIVHSAIRKIDALSKELHDEI